MFLTHLIKSERRFASFCSVMNAVGSVWIVLIMVLIMTDVTGRVVLNAPIDGTSEMAKLSLVGIVFLQLAYVLGQNRHIRATMVYQRLGPAKQEMVNVLACALGIALFYLLVQSNWHTTVVSVATLEYEMASKLHVPVFPFRILLLVGCVLMIIQFVINLRQSLVRLIKPSGVNS